MIDPVTLGFLGFIGKYAVGPALSKLVEKTFGTVSAATSEGSPQAITINMQNQHFEIQSESGVVLLSAPDELGSVDEPSIMEGTFLSEDSFSDLAYFYSEDGKVIAMLVVDLDAGEVSWLFFDFDGYAINIGPGNYLIYAFIVDPNTEEMLGFGYPCLDDLEDLNPLCIPCGEELKLDFILSDIGILEQYG